MSKLDEISKQYRDCTIVKNTYKCGNEYVLGHPNAISDGDELGKGENNDQIGGLTDIKTRNCSIVKNPYNENKPYCAGAC